MTTDSLDLDFQKADPRFPGPSIARIRLKTYTSNEAGRIFITPSCVTYGELEENVNRLRAELDEVLGRGRERFGRDPQG